MKIDIKATFKLMIVYAKNVYETYSDDWDLGYFLSSITIYESFFHSDSPTSDPAYWYDWKELIEEELEKDDSIIDENNGLSLEQGLVTIQYFLEQKYWIKNNNVFLKYVCEDLIRECNANKNNLENSQLWQEWLVAVNEGKKFDKIFTAGTQ